MNVIEKNITLADGRVITLETGKLAKQADGAVMLKMCSKQNPVHGRRKNCSRWKTGRNHRSSRESKTSAVPEFC